MIGEIADRAIPLRSLGSEAEWASFLPVYCTVLLQIVRLRETPNFGESRLNALLPQPAIRISYAGRGGLRENTLLRARGHPDRRAFDNRLAGAREACPCVRS